MPQSRSSRTPEVLDRRPPLPAGLPPDAGEVLVPLARAAIAGALGVRPTLVARPGWLAEPGASFVTLHTAGELHGCVGSTAPRGPLGADVTGNARAAAFRDPRFAPLTRAELDLTVLEVSVLSALAPLDVVDEADALSRLRVGVDGLVLEYAGRRATFLPQVWDELPDPQDFLARLKIKLGLPATFWDARLTLSRYTVAAFSEGEPS